MRFRIELAAIDAARNCWAAIASMPIKILRSLVGDDQLQRLGSPGRTIVHVIDG